MCTGMEIAALAMSGIGTVMQMQSADDAAAEQKRIINQAAEEEARLNDKKAQTIEGFAKETYDPKTRDQRYEQAATKQETSLVDSLLKANAGNNGGEIKTAAEGDLSSDYTRAKGAATAAATEDILKRARLMARAGAGGQMFNDEALKGGQLSSDVAGINSSINRTNRDAQTQLGGVRNDGSLVGGLLTGLGPAVGKYGAAKQGEWDAYMKAVGG